MAKRKKSSPKRKASSSPKRKVAPAQKIKAKQKKSPVQKPVRKVSLVTQQKRNLAKLNKKIKAQASKPEPVELPKYARREIIRPTGKTLKPVKPIQHPPRKRAEFDKTKSFKRFNKKFLRKTDDEYKKEIKDFWKQQYDKKIPLSEILKQTKARYVNDTRNRLRKSKRPYWGKSIFKKDKKGNWVGGKPRKRYLWRDKLKGKWIRGKNVGEIILKILEPVHVRNYMKIHKIKNYQTARKKYLKETRNMALGQIVQLYGYYP